MGQPLQAAPLYLFLFLCILAMNSTYTNLITMTMTEGHWLRIRAALLCSAEDLAKAGSDQEKQYKHTHELVKQALALYIS